MKYNISFNIRIIMAPQQTRQQRTSKSKVGIWKPKSGFEPIQEDDDVGSLPFDDDSLYTPDRSQICFWYVPMSDSLKNYGQEKMRENWGIHMDVKCFEKKAQTRPILYKRRYFHLVFMHEYLHHIVDSWAFDAEFEPDYRLEMKYSIERDESRPFKLEETLANANFLFYVNDEHVLDARNWSKENLIFGGSYKLWNCLTHDEDGYIIGNLWVGVSNHVAFQISTKNLHAGPTRHKGWDEKTIKQLKTVHPNLPANEYFTPEEGFKQYGKYAIDKIPFHLHNQANSKSIKEYKCWRESLVDEDWIRDTWGNINSEAK